MRKFVCPAKNGKCPSEVEDTIVYLTNFDEEFSKYYFWQEDEIP